MSKLSSKTSKPQPAQGGLKFGIYGMFEGVRLYLTMIVILIVVLLGWMSMAQIDQVVRVEGKIIPAGRSQQIQHLEGGIVSSIAAQEGALVKKGDVLVTIDSTQAGATLSETNVKLENQQAHAARLQAEVDAKSEVEFPGNLKDLPIAQAEIQLFNARREKLNKEISVSQSMLNQRMAELAEARSRKEKLTTELATATERSGIIEGMARNGAASKLEILDARSRQQSLKTQLGEVIGALPKLEAAIGEARGRIDSAKSEFRAEAQNELVATLGEIERLKQVSTAASDRMKRTDIKAPVDGIVNSVAINTVGGVVKPGENLLEITPITDKVQIEARAAPRDRGNLRSNLKAEIRVSAYDAGEYGLIQGHVTKVGADSIQDQRNESYYQVNITVDAIPDRYENRELIPGMTVTADVVTGRRTILSYLLSPLRKFTYNMFRDPR